MKAERRKRAAEIRKQMLEKLKKDQAIFASTNQDDLKEIDTKVNRKYHNTVLILD